MGHTERALEVLGTDSRRFPGYRDLLVAFAAMNRDLGRRTEGVDYA
jgi:hypothetical protein